MSHTMYVIKTAIMDTEAKRWTFARQKTMYGGKLIAKGDVIFVFASETQGGVGLIAQGIVTSAEATPRRDGPERQTPRVNITVMRSAHATRSLGRKELRPFCNWDDGHPATELNFKFYRQATNKIGGITAEAATYLQSFF
jgi:hypothetical protein